MSIILDTRERDLIKLFNESEINVKSLPVGDVWITSSPDFETPGGIVLERKTVADLEASLTDGRYREQRTRLLAFCAEKKARAIYCIEGCLDRLDGKKTQHELWAILNRLMFRYGVFVMQTDSLEDTAKYIKTIASQIEKEATVFEGQQLSYSDVTSFTKKGNKEDPKQFALAVLQQCPGISANGAKAIYDQFQSLSCIFSATAEQIAEVRVGNRRLGNAVASRLHTLLHAAIKTSS